MREEGTQTAGATKLEALGLLFIGTAEFFMLWLVKEDHIST